MHIATSASHKVRKTRIYFLLRETMAMTGHQSVATVMGYFRAESALGSKVSRMLDEE